MGFNSVFCFRPSLNLFSGCPVLRAPVAMSEKKTIFGRCASSIQTTCPTPRSFGFMMSASMHGMLALRSNFVLETLSSQEMPITTWRHRRWNWSSFFGIAAKFHSHREGTVLCTYRLVPKVMPCSPHTRVHNLPKEAPALASLFDTSLSMLQLGWSHCSPQVLEELDLCRSKSWLRLQQHLCLLA